MQYRPTADFKSSQDMPIKKENKKGGADSFNRVEKYLLKQAQILNNEFETIRLSSSDSEVKGGKNEEILKRFIEKHFKINNFITTRAEIIDSFGERSNEIDIVVCNNYQPFSDSILIAEGVDFVVQVKAVMTSSELERSIENSIKLKTIRRQYDNMDEITLDEKGLFESFVHRIPYIVFAYESKLSIERLTEKINHLMQACTLEDAIFPFLFPDFIFVLNKGFVFNFRGDIDHSMQPRDGKYLGYAGFPQKEGALLNFIRFIHTIPKVTRMTHPIHQYFQNVNDFLIYGQRISQSKVEEILKESNDFK
jgi:hypothetical protein